MPPSSSSRPVTVPPSGGTAPGAALPPAGAAELLDTIGGYSFSWLIVNLEHHGRKQFGRHFTIRRADYDLVRRLLVYFLADASQAAQLGIDLCKGIALTGPIGCGKTSLMSLMRLIPGPDRNFTMKPTRDVSFEFIQDGYEVIHRYSRLSFHANGPRTYCFDDLGAEQALKYYGNECNVMAEVILSRYEFYTAFKMRTHLTTNLKASEVDDMYGPRIRSRMREMFNLIAFTTTSDKRI
ncbi:P-loop NTPase family protein [Parachryseolinea silvisoli]|uniref:ATPase n=1 Tax=Parachryseolinea silvisoli TaxID=2873601 RepID=UPI002265EF63|nr:ATPase [Parachryseolinea silvisoli]MCD9015179.1 ATPase [Parachryseolinea silvisoli]